MDVREALLFLDFRLDLVEFFSLSSSLICCSALVKGRELSFHANQCRPGGPMLALLHLTSPGSLHEDPQITWIVHLI